MELTHQERRTRFCSIVKALGSLAHAPVIRDVGGLTRREQINDQRLAANRNLVEIINGGREDGRWDVTDKGQAVVDPDVVDSVVKKMEIYKEATRTTAVCPCCGKEAKSFNQVCAWFGYRRMRRGSRSDTYVQRPQSQCRECRVSNSKIKRAQRKEKNA